MRQKKHRMAFICEPAVTCRCCRMESDAVSVDIWSMDLGLCSTLAEVGDILSPEEISRARRLPSDVRRRRYIVCHIALRIILSDYAEIESRNLKFLIDRHGKPAIDAEQNGRDIRFNLSHSSDKAIIAVAFGHEVGVDIEGVKAGEPPGRRGAILFGQRIGEPARRSGRGSGFGFFHLLDPEGSIFERAR